MNGRIQILVYYVFKYEVTNPMFMELYRYCVKIDIDTYDNHRHFKEDMDFWVDQLYEANAFSESSKNDVIILKLEAL